MSEGPVPVFGVLVLWPEQRPNHKVTFFFRVATFRLKEIVGHLFSRKMALLQIDIGLFSNGAVNTDVGKKDANRRWVS